MPISVDIPEEMREELEAKKKEEYYSSMSEVIRDAIREFLRKDEELDEKEKAILKLVRKGRFEEVKLEGEAEESVERGLEQLEEA